MAKAKRPLELEDAAGIAKMLADPVRLTILSAVAFDGPISVGGISETLKLRQPTVSHHLGLLRMAGIVACKRSGKQVFYEAREDLPRNAGARALKAMLDKLAK